MNTFLQNANETLRMYAILRGDLNMSPGKSASQAGHAFKLLTKQIITEHPVLAADYFSDGDMGTNIVLKSKNQFQLERAFHEAKAAGIPAELIIDSGHIMPPHFDGSPIITALGIGPARREQINHITKRFNCVK